MTQLQMFIPLTKIDAGKRLVYGVVTAETPDRGNEVCDYASTKPYYQKWSDEFRKASGGKSLGNLRAMHGKVAAGRVEAIHFNDDDKQIEVCAKIIDDAEWAKVEAGVYTGFSQGGGYVKRWPDENDPDLMRYTASPCEISLVDLPCLPSATFAMIKADGAVETMKFASFDNAVEQVWMAGDGKTFKKKAEALAHQTLLASSASMLGALERMENDLGKAAPAPRTQALERLRKCLGQEAFDAGRAIAALQIVFDVLAAEIAEGEDDEGQIAALQDAIVRLKDFIVAEISEDDEDDEQPLRCSGASRFADAISPRSPRRWRRRGWSATRKRLCSPNSRRVSKSSASASRNSPASRCRRRCSPARARWRRARRRASKTSRRRSRR